MTYKKAIKICCDILREYGFTISKTAQKQIGYLALFATEREISKQLHHQLKAKIQQRPCQSDKPSMDDETFITYTENYAKLLASENPEGGEISLGWLLKEIQDEEVWKVYRGELLT